MEDIQTTNLYETTTTVGMSFNSLRINKFVSSTNLPVGWCLLMHVRGFFLISGKILLSHTLRYNMQAYKTWPGEGTCILKLLTRVYMTIVAIIAWISYAQCRPMPYYAHLLVTGSHGGHYWSQLPTGFAWLFQPADNKKKVVTTTGGWHCK